MFLPAGLHAQLADDVSVGTFLFGKGNQFAVVDDLMSRHHDSLIPRLTIIPVPESGQTIHDAEGWRDDAQRSPPRVQSWNILVVYQSTANSSGAVGNSRNKSQACMVEVPFVIGQREAERLKRRR